MDLNDYPEQNRVNIQWKPIALIAGVSILVIVILVVSIRYIQGRKQSDVLTQMTGSNASEMVEDTCKDADDPVACQDAMVSDLASQHGSTELCDMLSDQESQDNCYWELARTLEDTSICGKISSSEWSIQCQDDVVQNSALQQNDATLCEDIQDTGKRNRCLSTINPLSVSTCDQDEDPVLCEDLAWNDEALDELDSSLCWNIADENRRDTCLEDVSELSSIQSDDVEPVDTTIDSDNDGLTDEEEAEYGTDPQNPDTDGDGYSDGEEVESGYNPLGSGKIE